MSQRITIRDIAERTGLHFTTVARALRSTAGVSSTTYDKVHKVAKEMGYSPDPFLSALNAYRLSTRPANFRGTLAFVTNWSDEKGWQKFSQQYAAYYEGGRQAAEELGYNLEHFWIRPYANNLPRFVKILKSRGVPGLILAPQEKAGAEINISLDDLSFVSLGYSTLIPSAHVVVGAQFMNAAILMDKVKEYGYKRPALCISRNLDVRTGRNWSGAFMANSAAMFPESFPLQFTFDEFNDQQFTAWYEANKPDVIVTQGQNIKIFRCCKKLGIRIPEDLGVVLFSTTRPEFSGMDENSLSIGRTAVETLAGLIFRVEKGLPKQPIHTLVEGHWHEGKTLQCRSKAEVEG